MLEKVLEDAYNRIISGKPYDVNYKAYKKEFIQKIIEHFESTEEYEKCKTLSEFLTINEHDHGYTI
jgi:hypothetical protein